MNWLLFTRLVADSLGGEVEPESVDLRDEPGGVDFVVRSEASQESIFHTLCEFFPEYRPGGADIACQTGFLYNGMKAVTFGVTPQEGGYRIRVEQLNPQPSSATHQHSS